MYIYIRSLTRNLPKIYILCILYIYIYVHNGLVMDVRVRRLAMSNIRNLGRRSPVTVVDIS